MKPKAIDVTRIRRLPRSYSWVDHRFVTERHIDTMEPDEILLYYFLVTVGNKEGVSYYSPERMVDILKIDVTRQKQARRGLERKDYIAYREGVFQVLELPGGGVWTKDYGVG